MQTNNLKAVDWRFADSPVDYPAAVQAMEERVAAIRAGSAPELVWLLEHPPLYTAGTSAKPEDLHDGAKFPVYTTGRGGQYTYHGPGQRVGYVMLDLQSRGGDVRAYVRQLEEWLIVALAQFNLSGERREDRIGIWIDRGNGREDKIAALGVRVRRGVAYHGVSINIDCDLSHYSGIVPCGIGQPIYGVTSLLDLGIVASVPEVDAALRTAFDSVFGRSGVPV